MSPSGQGGGDDTAMNGISMRCNVAGSIRYEGFWGNWESGTRSCNGGFTGVTTKLESKQASCDQD